MNGDLAALLMGLAALVIYLAYAIAGRLIRRAERNRLLREYGKGECESDER